MDDEDVTKGTEKFKELVARVAPTVSVIFKLHHRDQYNVVFIGSKSTSRLVSEVDLADLGRSDRPTASIVLVIKEALEEIRALGSL